MELQVPDQHRIVTQKIMSKKALVILVILILISIFAFYSLNKDESVGGLKNENLEKSSSLNFDFNRPKKSAHYETNTPAHASVLAASPINIVIDFNFDLAPPSSISIKKDGVEYSVGETVIDSNKLVLRKNFDADAPNGLYKVDYNACWPDRSCHQGYFEFAIDRDTAVPFQDMRNKSEITIRMSEIKFLPKDLIVSPNTKVIWVNDDDTIHYVNTDSHPAHTYFEKQNSKALNKGELHSVVFSKIGAYPYHCSAHTEMTGNIIVQ